MTRFSALSLFSKAFGGHQSWPEQWPDAAPKPAYDAIIVGGGHNGLVAASYLAKAGKSVVLLESASELGGATTSVRPFPEYDARLSRYSYLVSLLPDQIVADLGINFKTLPFTKCFRIRSAVNYNIKERTS